MAFTRATLTVMALTSILTACVTPAPLTPGAENVLLSNKSASSSCHYVGEIARLNHNGVEEAYTTHENLQAVQINALKNEAFQRGGNYVQLTDHATIYQRAHRSRSQTTLESHALTGRLYTCPAAALSQQQDQLPEKRTENAAPEHALFAHQYAQ